MLFSWPRTVPHHYYQTKILLGRGNYSTNIDWIDNERVFFYGHDLETPPQTVEEAGFAEKNKRFLFTWVPGDRAKIYPDKGWSGAPATNCAGNGIIRYEGSRSRSGETGADLYYRGPIGSEAKIDLEGWIGRALKKYGKYSVNPRSSDCSFVAYPDHQKFGRQWLPFDDNEGYLLFAPYKDFDRRDDVIDIYDPKTDRLTRLDIPGLEVKYSCSRYNVYLGTYITWDCAAYASQNFRVSVWEETNCYPVWAIWSDGRTRKYCLPFGPWAGAASDIYITITQKGLFFAWMKSGQAAAYLVGEDGQAQLIRKGFYQKPSVSPDGCKVAAGYFSSFFEGSWIYGSEGQHAAVIDLCVDENQRSQGRK